MIVSCPACEIRFEVDEAQLGPDGRIVRCGKCGNCWHQMPEIDPRAVAAAAEEAVPPPPPRRRAAPPAKKKGRGLLVGWVLLLLFIGGIAAVGWFERGRIVEQFPQMRDLYALLQVPLPESGPTLQLSDVNAARDDEGSDVVITVRGRVANISERKQKLPALRIQFTGADGAVVKEWFYELPQSELDAGDAVEFETETRNPPEEAQNLSVNFAGRAEPVEPDSASSAQ